jgi:antitoxin component YwqK of YwqJK toxin-antitoxin module
MFIRLTLPIMFFAIISCQEKNPQPINNMSILKDTTYLYHKDGKIKSKGILKDSLPVGWWYNYDNTGNLISKIEYVVLDDTLYENQIVYYHQAPNIDFSKSSFFKIKVPDTLKVGKNKGELVSYNSNFKGQNILVSVIVENKYSDSEIKKDTFSDGTLTPYFGIYAHKTGKKKIKVTLLEEVLNEIKVTNDSSFLRIIKHNKYFEKEVYVID